jgi:outer membrane receptor protein involved in Fe transport
VVRDAQGGAPLGDVAVFAPELRRGAVTDASGRFRFGGLPIGQVRLVAQRVGLGSDTLVVAVSPGVVTQADFALRDAAAVITPVIVSATRELQRRADGSVTIDVLDGAEIRRTRAAHPSGIMNRVPGVHVSELSGEGHSMSMRQPITTKPMYLYLEDGVPTRATGFFNHNALYEVNIPQAGGLEVIKGPGTALYGSDAIGGIVNVLTRPAPLTGSLDGTFEGGAYGYRRLLLTGGTTVGHHGVRADLNVTRSETWKNDAPFRRESGSVRWDAVLGASGWSAKTVLTGSRIDQQDVPSISTTQFSASPALNLAPIAYRKVRALRLSNSVEREAGSGLWSFTSYGRIDDMQLLPSWQLTYDPQTWDTKNNSLGFLAKYRRDFTPMRARVIVGVDGDWSPGRFVANRAIVSRTGTDRVWATYQTGAAQYDYDVTYRALSPYLHTEVSPVRRLRIDAGLRSDFSGYDYRTHLTPVDTGAHRRPPNGSVSYAHLSPKLGATLELSPQTNVYASYRQGFRAPSQGQLYQQNSAANTVDLKPVKVDSYEVGVRGQLAARMAYQLAAYDMTIRDDIITYATAQNTREATNAGRTRHRGVEAGVGLAIASSLRLDASWSVARQRYVEWTPQAAAGAQAAVSYGGRAIEQAPRDLGNVLLTFTPRALQGGRLAVEWSKTGRYATDPANTHSYAGYDLVHLHTSAFVRHDVELFARMSNVLDRKYAELLAYDVFQGDQYTPGAPRSIYAGIRYAF